jgi:hypothetical protein
MRGVAAFWSNAGPGGPAFVYRGAKRQAPDALHGGVRTQNRPGAPASPPGALPAVALGIPDPGIPVGNILSYNTDIHTERQLAIVALEDHVLGGLQQVGVAGIAAPVAVRAAPTLVNDSLIPDDPNFNAAPLFPAIGGVNGHLHIYTPAKPCQNECADNGMYSCLEYYLDLLNACLGLNIHAYCHHSEPVLWAGNVNGLGLNIFPSACIAVLEAIDNAIIPIFTNNVPDRVL